MAVEAVVDDGVVLCDFMMHGLGGLDGSADDLLFSRVCGDVMANLVAFLSASVGCVKMNFSPEV